MERAVLAVDVDHALAKLQDAVVAWHNEQAGDKLQVEALTADGWKKLRGALEGDKRRAFFSSTQFQGGLAAVEGAKDALQPLRSLFSLVAVADRPRSTERATREWLDANFGGVFDRLLVVDGADAEAVGERKKKLFGELKVRAAVGVDVSTLAPVAAGLERCIRIGLLPWAKDQKSKAPKTTEVEDWPEAKEALEQLAADLELKPADKVAAGPKLTRGTDDLVVVTLRKPAVFYANMISAKMTRQNQETIRLQATEGAITTAVQTAEMLRAQSITTTAKIATRYVVSRSKDQDNYRVPKIELLLQRIDRKP